MQLQLFLGVAGATAELRCHAALAAHSMTRHASFTQQLILTTTTTTLMVATGISLFILMYVTKRIVLAYKGKYVIN